MRKCASSLNNYPLTLIKVGFFNEYQGHSLIMILNRKFKTIEFYDPTFIKNTTGTWYKHQQALENFMTIEVPNYEWLGASETCPPVNFQVYENVGVIDSRVRSEGFCILWSCFIAHLRILYHDISPESFRDMLISLINHMKRELSRGNKMNPFAKFIYEYALYAKKNFEKTIRSSKNSNEWLKWFDWLNSIDWLDSS